MRHQGAITITQRSYAMGWRNFLIRIFNYKNPYVFAKIDSQCIQSTNIEEKSCGKGWKKSRNLFLTFWIFTLCQQGVLAFRDFTIRDPSYFMIYFQALISWITFEKGFFLIVQFQKLFEPIVSKRGESENPMHCWLTLHASM